MGPKLNNEVFSHLHDKIKKQDLSLKNISSMTGIKEIRLKNLSVNKELALGFEEFELICCVLAVTEKNLFKDFRVERGEGVIDVYLYAEDKKFNVDVKTVKWFSAIDLEKIKSNENIDYAVIWSEREKNIRFYDLEKKRGGSKMENYQSILTEMKIPFKKDINNAIDFIFDDEQRSLKGLKFHICSVDNQDVHLIDFYLTDDNLNIKLDYPDFEFIENRKLEENIPLQSEKDLSQVLKKYFISWKGMNLGQWNSEYKKVQIIEIISRYVSNKKLYDQNNYVLNLDQNLRSILNVQDEKIRPGQLYERLRKVLKK